MNKTEFDLRIENLRMKMALAEIQSTLLQRQHSDAKAELDALLAAGYAAPVEAVEDPA